MANITITEHTMKCASHCQETQNAKLGYQQSECDCPGRMLKYALARCNELALEIASCGFDVEIMPVGYQLRIRFEGERFPTYDWYFTKSGSIVVTRSEDRPPGRAGWTLTPVEVVEFITKHEEEHANRN